MAEFIQVVTTTETKGEAQQIAQAAVEKRLAACAQIVGPISSTYWWKGKVESANEWMCLMKTRKSLFAELERAIREIHPYEIPEIVAVPIVAVSADYMNWLDNELKKEVE